MSGMLNHSPADIVRRVLIDRGYGVLPPARPWPMFIASEPDHPDDVITLYDTSSQNDGREMAEGESIKHHGFQIRLSATVHKIGYQKARTIAVGMDKNVFQALAVIDNSEYLVQCLVRKSNVIPLGKDVPTAKHSLFTINGLAVIKLLGIIVDNEYWPTRHFPDPYFAQAFFPRGVIVS